MKLGELIGSESEDNFSDFDLTEIQQVLARLNDTDAIDLSHAEQLQQQALRGADILSEYLGKLVKTPGYLEAKVNSVKNRVSLEYQAPEGRTTTDMKIWAGSSSPEVEELQIKLSKAKACKSVLERKYDILIKSHHHFKEIAQGIRRTIIGYNTTTQDEQIAHGYE
jgi:hypothetical protein